MRKTIVIALVMLWGCTSEKSLVADLVALPEGFPLPPVPEENPLTAEKIDLGRHLFYETRLSGNQTQSCGTCHKQALAFTDGHTVGEGSTGELHARNANGLTNVAYNASLTWANPILTELEEQMLLPLFGDDPIEMGASPGEDAVIARLADDPLYVDLFAAAFPEESQPIAWDPSIQAISSFMRTMISGNSRFDQFTYQDDRTALTDVELRGLNLFFSETLECHHCHGGFNLSESTVYAGAVFDAKFFHNTGLYNIDEAGAYPADNTGLFAITGNPEDMGKFRPPSLRNVALTGPYMHDGSIETLEEVLKHYERGGRLIEEGPYSGDGALSPLKSGLVPGFTLTDGERSDLIAFLHTLTDEEFLTTPRLEDPFQ